MTVPRVTGGRLPPLRAMRYLALGDSYTIGEGIAASDRWPVQLARALRDEGVALADPQVIARTGWSTDELSTALDAVDAGVVGNAMGAAVVGTASAASSSGKAEEQELAAEAAPTGITSRPYDLVSLLIGVNDQYRSRGVDDYLDGFASLLERAIGYAGDRADRVLVLSIPDWGVTPFAIQQGRDRAQIARELDAYNAGARELCTRRAVAFVDITPVSRAHGADADMLVDDGLHPSPAMYREWMRLALPVARRLLSR